MTEQQPNGNWFRQAIRQAPWRTQTQASSLVLAVVVMVAVIGALYLAQASRTAAAGRRLQELEVQRESLEQQNEQLRAEIARQIAAGRRNGSRFIMSLGSPVTPRTPVDRVRLYCDLARELGSL